MLTRSEAEALGWRLRVGTADGLPTSSDARAEKGAGENVVAFTVTSGIPLFMTLREISRREGGAVPDTITPQLVLQTSGESYVPPAPTPPTASMIAAAMELLRAIRDDWLNQAQPIFTEIKSPGVPDLSPVMLAGITQNRAAWIEWRQKMRDLPSLLGLDWVAAAASGAQLFSTSDAWPAPWPSPPAAPVIRRRKER